MNFGLTIIAISYIVFLIVPGIFFKRFYFQSKFQNDFYKGAFADKIITSIFWGIFIQALCLLIFKFTFDYSFDEIYRRLNNLYESLQDNHLPQLSYIQLKYLVGVFASSIVFSCLLGHLFHKLVRLFGLDIRFSPLRFSNDWHYIFRNELDASKSLLDGFNKTYYSTEVDIIVNDFKDDRPSFYSGMLKDYHLTPEGNLDRICLGYAKKRTKNKDGVIEFTDIKGDSLIIPYCNIANMNLRYNYDYKPKRKVIIPELVQGTLMLVMVFVLILILIVPWFSTVSVWSKILGVLLFTISWSALVSLISEWFNDEKRLNWPMRLFVLAILLVTLFSALNMLKIYDILSVFELWIGSFRT